MSTRAPTLDRASRKAETRRALVEAASELFARQGIEATSVDEVAAHVGLTKGAVYAHFRSKGDLVEEVLQAASVVVDPQELLDPGLTLGERFAVLGREAAALLPDIPRRSIILHVEYYLYVLRDRARHRRSLREQRRHRADDGARFEEVAREREEQMLVPGRELVALLEAVGNGIVLEVVRDPDAFGAETIAAFFAALGYGLENTRAVSALLSKRSST